mmetsp:Transcript_25741/g.39982  ORF Transcript_25741/g.39982 Transcript_25741/m.39982 type:complete len:210 (-) Transcript_25741:1006-1635(-)
MVVVVVLALVLLVVVGLVVLALVAAMAVGDLLAVVTAVVEVLVARAVPAVVAGELAAVAFLSEPTMALHLKPGDSTLVHQAVLLLLLLSRDLRHLLALELLSKSVQSLLYQPAQVVLQQHDVALLLHLQSYFEVLHAVVLIDEAHSQWHDVIAVHLPQCFQWHHVIVAVVGHHHHRLHPLGLKFVFSYDDDDDDAPDYYFVGHYFDLVH